MLPNAMGVGGGIYRPALISTSKMYGPTYKCYKWGGGFKFPEKTLPCLSDETLY